MAWLLPGVVGRRKAGGKIKVVIDFDAGRTSMFPEE